MSQRREKRSIPHKLRQLVRPDKSLLLTRSFRISRKRRRYNSTPLRFWMNRATRRVASPHVVSIEDLRPLAQRKLPRVVFDYLDGGAEGEVTLRENCRAFQEVTFRPRHAVAIPHCDLRTRVVGVDLSL